MDKTVTGTATGLIFLPKICPIIVMVVRYTITLLAISTRNSRCFRFNPLIDIIYKDFFRLSRAGDLAGAMALEHLPTIEIVGY